MICDDILQSMNKSNASDDVKTIPQTVEKVEKEGGKIPPMLAAACKNLLDADYVALSGIEIQQNQWMQCDTSETNDTEQYKAQLQSARTTLMKVSSVCSSYS